jgi:hypothetical protein
MISLSASQMAPYMGLWLKVVHYLGNRVSFGKQTLVLWRPPGLFLQHCRAADFGLGAAVIAEWRLTGMSHLPCFPPMSSQCT